MAAVGRAAVKDAAGPGIRHNFTHLILRIEQAF